MIKNYLTKIIIRYKFLVEGYNLADSISKLVTEKYPVDSAFFYFETPNYKVRVGKFKSRIIAEKKLREIKQIFKSAFIFKPKVN